MGDTVFKNEVSLSIVERNTYKIASSDGERTFRIYDIVTMIGTYVEFDTYSALKVRCVFENRKKSQSFIAEIKENLYRQVCTICVFGSIR